MWLLASNRFPFPCVIRACGDAVEDLEVQKINALLFKFGLKLDVFVGSAFGQEDFILRLHHSTSPPLQRDHHGPLHPHHWALVVAGCRWRRSVPCCS